MGKRALTLMLALLLIVPSAYVPLSMQDIDDSAGGPLHIDTVPAGWIPLYDAEDLAKVGSGISQLGSKGDVQYDWKMDDDYILMNDVLFGSQDTNGSMDVQVTYWMSGTTLRMRVMGTTAGVYSSGYYIFDDNPMRGYYVNSSTYISIDNYANGTDHTILFGGVLTSPGSGSFVFTLRLTGTISSSTTTVTVSDTNGNFDPIGIEADPFKGSFNGNGYSVSGLDIRSYMNIAGFFGFISGAELTDLAVSGSVTAVNLKPNASNHTYTVGAGGIVGVSTRSVITGCSNNTNVNAYGAESISFVGGIAGVANSTMIAESSNSGNIKGRSHNTNSGTIMMGGIAGQLEGQSQSRLSYIYACTNSGTLSGDTGATITIYAGGMAGYCSDYWNVENCTNTGNMEFTPGGMYSYFGGIAGWAYDGQIRGSLNQGKISIFSDNASSGDSPVGLYVGGIVGELLGYVMDSSNEGEIEVVVNKNPINNVCQLYVGGIMGGTRLISSVQRCHNSGNINVDVDVTQNPASSHTQYVGGIAGYASSYSSPVSLPAVQDSYNEGNVTSNLNLNTTGTNNYMCTGGVTGVTYVGSEGPKMLNSYSMGNVSEGITGQTPENRYLGGVTGWVNVSTSNPSLTVEKAMVGCFYLEGSIDENEKNTLDTFSKDISSSELQDPSIFEDAGWDFKNTWTMGGNDTTPVFRTVSAIELTFDSMDGGSDVKMLTEKGVRVNAPDVQRNGYQFKGWFSDINGKGVEYKDSPLEEDMTFYAYWIAESSTVGDDAAEEIKDVMPWLTILLVIVAIITLAVGFFTTRED